MGQASLTEFVNDLYSIEVTIITFKAFHYCESNITILDLFNEEERKKKDDSIRFKFK